MKPELRRDLARQPFKEKIRKVSELIQLSRRVKASSEDARVSEHIPDRAKKSEEHEMKRERSGG